MEWFLVISGFIFIASLIHLSVRTFLFFKKKFSPTKDLFKPEPDWYFYISLITLYVVILGAYIIIVSLSNSHLGTSYNPPSRGVKLTPVVSDLNSRGIDVVTEAPVTMQINQSYEVRVSLLHQATVLKTKLTIEKAKAIHSEFLPVGDPSATLKNAFGPSAEVRAVATLSPNDGVFKITPIPPEEQPLNQLSVVWKWIVIPLKPGDQVLDVNIVGKWIFGNKDSIEVRIGDDQLYITVNTPPSPASKPIPTPKPEPLITFGQINITNAISSLIIALISAGSLGTFGAWLWKKRQKKYPSSIFPQPKQTKNRAKSTRRRRKP